MKKKEYSAPTMTVVELQQQHYLLTGSPTGTKVYESNEADDEWETL